MFRKSRHVFQSINFGEVPMLGVELVKRKTRRRPQQRWRLVKIEPYVRKDGTPSWLLSWEHLTTGAIWTSGLRSKSLTKPAAS